MMIQNTLENYKIIKETVKEFITIKIKINI